MASLLCVERWDGRSERARLCVGGEGCVVCGEEMEGKGRADSGDSDGRTKCEVSSAEIEACPSCIVTCDL
jgi:hypothetical protein